MSDEGQQTGVSQPDVIEMAKVALTSLITACSGVLIALLAFAAQADGMTGTQKFYAGWVAGNAGFGLWLAILSAIFGYLNTGVMWIGRPNRVLWWAAFGCALVSLLLLGGALCYARLLALA